MSKPRVIRLREDERFVLWGRRITSIKTSTDVVDFNESVAVRDRDGYVGSATPGQVPEIANALYERGRLGR